MNNTHFFYAIMNNTHFDVYNVTQVMKSLQSHVYRRTRIKNIN